MTSTSKFPFFPSQGRVPASLSFRSRVNTAEGANNPLFEAARPLLQVLADTPSELDNNAVQERHRWLEHEVRVFEKVCAELQLRPDHVQNTRYCLCSALDEAAMQTDWGKGVTTGVEWTTNGLSVAFGGDRQGGDRVFRIIGQALANPHENRDLIDVIQNILDLGFKGRYRFEAGGQGELGTMRHLVHDTVMENAWSMPGQRTRPRLNHPPALQRWQIDPWVRPTAPMAPGKARLSVTIALLLAVLVLSVFSYVVYERLTREARAAQSVPPADILAKNLNEILKSEIAAGTVNLDENAQHTALTLRFNDMFLPGETTVNAWVRPLVARVGQEIAGMPGEVQVTGYTDSLSPDKRQLVSNQTLSEERATQVMQILVAAGVPSDRLMSTGKGDANPVAGNETPEGRTKNRRVEVTVSE